MNDLIEKVIKGLEHCTSFDDGRGKFGGVGKCGGCPYYGYDCTDRIKKDALALLKEQKSDEPKTGHWICGKYDDIFMCSSCEKYSMDDYPYCHWCGAKMKQEGG